jgi:tetratricopeptide (TPR) repeat protein
LVLLALAFLVWPEGRARGAEATAQDRSSTSPSFQQQTLPPEQRGDLLMIHHQYLQAIDAYQQAPRDSAVVRNKLGIAYHHVFALDQAKTSYQEALRLKPKYGEALNNLGAVFYAQKDYRRAEKLYHRALKLLPQSATVYNNLGTAYFAHGKLKQGTEAYRTAFAIDPKVFSADPIETISEASSSEERARLDFCLAELFAQSGMKDQAILYLRKALDAGFSDNKRLMQDEGFASIRHTAEFAQLMAMVKQP